MFNYCCLCGAAIDKSESYCGKCFPKVNKKPLDEQAGGDHYKKYIIQPIEYCMVNKLNACQANIIKYATRYKDKNGVEDLLKIKHYVDIILQLEYSINNPKEIEY